VIFGVLHPTRKLAAIAAGMASVGRFVFMDIILFDQVELLFR
jgi:hypothetical protein